MVRGCGDQGDTLSLDRRCVFQVPVEESLCVVLVFWSDVETDWFEEGDRRCEIDDLGAGLLV